MNTPDKAVWGQYALLTLLLVGMAFGLASCAPSKDEILISIVKDGSLASHQNITLGKAVESFLGNPQWSVQRTADGNEYVSVIGDMTYLGKAVKGTLQFQVDQKTSSFKFQACEMNGIPQDRNFANILIEKFYK
jgi:hypothetical protein